MKNILLTGATGFLGSHLLNKILSDTDYHVIVLKRSFSDMRRLENNISNPRVKFYDIDKIDTDLIFEENQIETIIHCATNYGRKKNDAHEILETNLMFPIKLLDSAIKYEIKYFINTDSYFNKENMSYSYLLNYSLSKKSLLLWLKHFSSKIQISNMVLEHIYGEQDNEDKFVTKMIKAIAIEKIDSIDLTYGDQKRDFVYVDDVTNAYISVLKHMQNHKWRFKRFNVGTGQAISLKDFVTEIKIGSNSNTNLNLGGIPYRQDEIMFSCADTLELNDIGWKPKFSYKDGIRKIIGETNVQ